MYTVSKQLPKKLLSLAPFGHQTENLKIVERIYFHFYQHYTATCSQLTFRSLPEHENEIKTEMIFLHYLPKS